MAIVEELPGVDVTILVDGVPLHEYIDTDTADDDRTVSRYIEAASDKNFEVHIKACESVVFYGDCLACRIMVDGKQLDFPLINESDVTSGDHIRKSIGAHTSPTRVRKYFFASLETASDDRALRDELLRAKNIGTIVIKISHEVTADQLSDYDLEEESDVVRPIVSEKVLKGRDISHSVQLSKSVKTEEQEYCDTEPVNGQPSPFATYVFHYRSLAALKSMYIIPRTPTPPPLEERDFASLTQDELKELQKRARTARDEKETKAKVKRERTDDNPRQRKKARPGIGATQLELDEDGRARQSSTPTVVGSPEVIELD